MKTTALMTAIAALALGFSSPAFAEPATGATSEIILAQGTTSEAGPTGIEAGEENMDPAADSDPTDSEAGDETMNMQSGDDQVEGGTGIENSEDGEGATNKN